MAQNKRGQQKKKKYQRRKTYYLKKVRKEKRQAKVVYLPILYKQIWP